MPSPELLLLALSAVHAPNAADDDFATRSLFEFLRPDAAADWRPVHDRVMGGRSNGQVEGGTGDVTFRGEVSLENGGGFASFRVVPTVTDLSEEHGLRLEVLGEGRTWKLSIRTRQGPEDLNWQAPFRTVDGAWTAVAIPFSAFVPVYHGRFVADAPPLDPSAIRSLGLVIGDGQAGPFELTLRALGAWRADLSAAEPGSVAAALARTRTLADLFGLEVDVAELLSTLQWKERLVVVAEPLTRGDLGTPAARQLGRFLAEPRALARRDVRIVHLLGGRGVRVAGRTLGPEVAAELRRRWDLPTDRFGVALVGKDGGVKARWSSTVEVEALLERIDAMPMARDESAERR